MAEKTMHHAVIGNDTFELVDQSARADVSELKNAFSAEIVSTIPFFLDKKWLHRDEGKAWGTISMRTNSDFMNTGYIPCKVGDSISYKLSISAGFSVFAVFDANYNCLRYVEGRGQSEDYLIENTYTFVSGDAYFMCCGVKSTAREAFYYIEYNPDQTFQKTNRITESLDSLKSYVSVSSRNLLNEQPIKGTRTIIDLGSDVTFPNGVNISFNMENVTAGGTATFVALLNSENTTVTEIVLNNMRNMDSGIMFSEESAHNGRYESNAKVALNSSITFRYVKVNYISTIVSSGNISNFMLTSGVTPTPYVPYETAKDYLLEQKTEPNVIYSELNKTSLMDISYWGIRENLFKDAKGSVAVNTGLFTTKLIPVNTGDSLEYTLSCADGIPLLFIYDADMKIIASETIMATGIGNLITGTHVFAEGEKYFSFNGSLGSIDKYSLRYGNIPTLIREYVNNPKRFPDYWDSAINTAINSIISGLIAQRTGDNFVFITDQHWKSNAQYSSPIIDYIAEKTGIYNVFNGGDLVNTNNATSSGAICEMTDYIGSFKNRNIRLFSTLGNHDRNSVAQSDEGAILEAWQQYNAVIKPEEEWLNTDGTALCNVYKNESQKIKYIQFLFTADSGYKEEVSNILVSEIENAPNGWTVILMSHAYWNGAEPSQGAVHYAEDILNAIDNTNADVPLWICGHVHTDKTAVLTSTGGKNLRVVSTTTDCYSQKPSSPSMTKGTDTEQAFDVYQIDTTNRTIKITRIGAGSDRNYSY